MNGYFFRATLEPDGKLSHWLKVSGALLTASGVAVGESVLLDIKPLEKQPEPVLPADFHAPLSANPQAEAVWNATTTIARIDWIHWIESSKQTKTRNSRIANACAMLSGGKARVCCFDQSEFYSKGLSAPKAID